MRNLLRMLVMASLCLIMGAWATIPALAAETITLAPVKDNTLYEAGGSNGSGSHLFAGSGADARLFRAVLAFDIAGAIPSGATIEFATLQLHMSRTIAGETTVTAYALTRDWGEGASDAPAEEGIAVPATTDDATWLDAFHTVTPWTNAGGDHAAATSASAAVAGLGSYQWTGPGMVADVQGWLDDPSVNFGWVLIGDETEATTAKRFDSRENETESFRPQLTIFYDPDGVPVEGTTWGRVKQLY